MWYDIFKRISSVLNKAWSLAQSSGLTDEIITLALPYIKAASTKYVDNADRREWVVRTLMDRHVSEGVARIATELAYKVYKTETAKLGV